MTTNHKYWKPAAKAVVIGGGISGCSAAYHLAKCGITDVVLIERSKLSSGTTWHSAGNMETYRDDALAFQMVRYAVESFPTLEQETGLTVGWRQTGRVMFTDRPDRLDQFRTLPELGRVRGIELGLLSPDEVKARLPIIDLKDLVGGLWIPSDGRVNPTDLVMAYARAAKQFGATIIEDVTAYSINSSGGSISSVETDSGKIDTDVVVLAAGLWSNELAETCGVRLPLHALEHLYLITEPIPGLNRNMPMFLSFDDQLYGREEVGGLIIGCLDSDAIPISTEKLGKDFAFSLLNERWDQFEPYLAKAMQRFPVLESTGVKMLLNGPESFTPDDKMLLGPVPEVSGLFAMAAMNSNGIALAPAAGRSIAEWIAEGAPRADVSSIDIRRFHKCQTSAQFMEERVTEVASYACSIHSEGDDYRTARNIRCSPLHKALKQAGAHFKSVCGWERPHWFARSGEQTDWYEWVGNEFAMASSGSLLVDRSADVKLGLYGGDVEGWLSKLSPNVLCDTSEDLQSAVRLVDARGRVQALCQVIRLVEGGWLLIAEPEQETRLKEYFRRCAIPEEIELIDHTMSYGGIEIIGTELLAAVLQQIPSATVGRDHHMNSTLVLIKDSETEAVWNRLMGAATENIAPGGFIAREALRIVGGISRFGHEIDPFTQVLESESEYCRAPTPVDTGHDCTTLRILPLSSPWELLGRSSGDAILWNGQVIGKVTSGIRLPGWEMSALLGRVDARIKAEDKLEVVAMGRRWPLSLRPSGCVSSHERVL